VDLTFAVTSTESQHSRSKNTIFIDKKFSYRKHIVARQLRTHYVEGVYINSVTLKSRLDFTQGHYK